MKTFRLYRVTRNLALVLILEFLVSGVTGRPCDAVTGEGFLSVVTLVAVLLGVFLPCRPDQCLSNLQRMFFVLLVVPALLQMFFVSMWVYRSSVFDGLRSRVFAAIIRDADRIVIRDGGGGCCRDPDKEPSLYVITNKAEIAEFNAMFSFSHVKSPCMCCGYPGIDWWKGNRRIALTAVHHGNRLQWSGFSGNARFTPESRQRIRDWFMKHCKLDLEKDVDMTPIYLNCRFCRDDVESDARKWMASHNGQRPTLDILREGASKKNDTIYAECPAGGKYTLTYDDQGNPVVKCSAPGHDF